MGSEMCIRDRRACRRGRSGRGGGPGQTDCEVPRARTSVKRDRDMGEMLPYIGHCCLIALMLDRIYHNMCFENAVVCDAI